MRHVQSRLSPAVSESGPLSDSRRGRAPAIRSSAWACSATSAAPRRCARPSASRRVSRAATREPVWRRVRPSSVRAIASAERSRRLAQQPDRSLEGAEPSGSLRPAAAHGHPARPRRPSRCRSLRTVSGRARVSSRGYAATPPTGRRPDRVRGSARSGSGDPSVSADRRASSSSRTARSAGRALPSRRPRCAPSEHARPRRARRRRSAWPRRDDAPARSIRPGPYGPAAAHPGRAGCLHASAVAALTPGGSPSSLSRASTSAAWGPPLSHSASISSSIRRALCRAPGERTSPSRNRPQPVGSRVA